MDGGVFSCDVHIIKPDPAIYEKICEKFDLIPEECLCIDDNGDKVKAAQNFGMHSIRFQEYETSYKEIMEYLSENGKYELIHDDGSYRADRTAVSAGETFFMVNLRQTIFVIKDCTCGAGFLTGSAAFAVFLIDIDLLFGNIGIIGSVHGSIKIGDKIIDFSDFSKTDHDRINFRFGKYIIQCLLIMFGQITAAKGFHGKATLSGFMALCNAFHHFFFCG